INSGWAAAQWLVSLDRSNATNSGGMLGEPFPHLLVGPGPLKRVRVASVVFRSGPQHMLNQLLPSGPRATFEVMIPKRLDQQLCLVQPRGMDRREAGTPPTLASRPVFRRVAGRVAGVPILDQEYALQSPMPPAKGFQLPDVVVGVF